MHLSPAALDATIRLLEEPAGPSQAGRGLQTIGDVGSWREMRSMNPGGRLAVRQGFEPWVQV